jgi:molecular chaperone DnaK
VEKNTPLPCKETETFKLVHPDQKLVHLKFFNMVNDNEESIGDLWLGIDEEGLDHKDGPQAKTEALGKERGPLNVEITLEIDENNLIEATATMEELPNVRLSKTLSRGSADEKLLVSLEEIISEANRKKYGGYVTIDLLMRALSAIKDANRVVDPETGRLDEQLYERANLKIKKAGRMATEGRESRPLIYYAKNALFSFGSFISEDKKRAVLKKVEHLKEMDEQGSYEENVQAIDDLDSALDRLGGINLLMEIQKAGDLCTENEPSRAAKFYRAIEDILKAFAEQDDKEANAQIEGIWPEARAVIKKYDRKTGVIYKDITR